MAPNTPELSSSEELDYSHDTYGTPSPPPAPLPRLKTGSQVVHSEADSDYRGRGSAVSAVSGSGTGTGSEDIFGQLGNSSDMLSSVEEGSSSEIQYHNEEFEYEDSPAPPVNTNQPNTPLFQRHGHGTPLAVEYGSPVPSMATRAHSVGVLPSLQV